MLDNYLPFLFFVLAMVASPGPGNLTMMAIGQTGGFRSALPFLSGAIISFTMLNTLVAAGLGEFYTAVPMAAPVLKICGMVYILHLAVKILRIQLAEHQPDRRFKFVEGFLIHPLSPKSWAMSVTGFSQFALPTGNGPFTIMVFVLTFFVNQVFFHSLWCASGATIMGFLRDGMVRRSVGVLLSGLMVTATAWAFFA